MSKVNLAPIDEVLDYGRKAIEMGCKIRLSRPRQLEHAGNIHQLELIRDDRVVDTVLISARQAAAVQKYFVARKEAS